jgi:AraC-like DNA-binding protein
MVDFSGTKQKIEEKYHLAFEGSVTQSEYFFFETNPRHTQRLAIVFGGYERCGRDFEIARKSYPYYVIEYPIKGKCELKIDSNSYILQRGYIAGFSPSCSHHYKVNPDEPMEHIFIAFTGSQAKLLFEQSTLGKGKAIFLSRPKQIFLLAESILNKALEKTEYSQKLCSSLLRTLLLELAHNSALPGKSGSISKETYRRCRKYIDENFEKIPTPVYAADACDVNVRYMAKLFRQYGDLTPQKYIIQLKMNKAASLLLTTNLKIREIARMTGFDDPYHFSKNFKKIHTISPKRYREKVEYKNYD